MEGNGKGGVIDLTDTLHTPNYGRKKKVFVRGEGAYIFDDKGRKYLDFLAGISVNALGHSDPKVVSAVVEQAGRFMHVSNLFYIPSQAEFLKEFATTLPWQGKSFLCNSGAEAVETAIKLARKYSRDSGRDRHTILSFTHSFHGRTYGALSATAQEKFHKGFEPMLPGFEYLEPGDRDGFDSLMKKGLCAVILEPVQGEGGVRPFEKEFIQYIAGQIDNSDTLLICDEIQCGLGRTGRFYAFEHYGLVPHIITMAKGIACGLPLGVMAAKEDVAESLGPGTHGSTFGGNPLSCAAGVEVVRRVKESSFLKEVENKGKYFRGRLDEMASRVPIIESVRGLGLMQALVLHEKGAPFVDRCMELGLIINCTEETVLRFLPPLIVDYDEIDEALNVLMKAFEERR